MNHQEYVKKRDEMIEKALVGTDIKWDFDLQEAIDQLVLDVIGEDYTQKLITNMGSITLNIHKKYDREIVTGNKEEA